MSSVLLLLLRVLAVCTAECLLWAWGNGSRELGGWMEAIVVWGLEEFGVRRRIVRRAYGRRLPDRSDQNAIRR